jgi:hypothetical protein
MRRRGPGRERARSPGLLGAWRPARRRSRRRQASARLRLRSSPSAAGALLLPAADTQAGSADRTAHRDRWLALRFEWLAARPLPRAPHQYCSNEGPTFCRWLAPTSKRGPARLHRYSKATAERAAPTAVVASPTVPSITIEASQKPHLPGLCHAGRDSNPRPSPNFRHLVRWLC